MSTLKSLIVGAIFAAMPATTALAQKPAAKTVAATDTISAKFAGDWEGTYYSDHAGENTLRLAIARDTAWKVTMEVVSPQNMPPLAIHDFKVDGTTATWTEELMGMSCASSAKLVAGTLKGEITCGTMSIGFLLRKK